MKFASCLKEARFALEVVHSEAACNSASYGVKAKASFTLTQGQGWAGGTSKFLLQGTATRLQAQCLKSKCLQHVTCMSVWHT